VQHGALVALMRGDSAVPRSGLLDLPPTRADVAISRAWVRVATPATERPLRVLTWLADEKLLLTAVAAFWVNARLRSHNERVRWEADRMLIGVAIAGVVPHLFKHLVNRKRPDRTLVHGPRHGIPRSGDAWDSFPSGHAVHIGALAAPLLRVSPSPMRPLVGAGLAGLAATRILLLAHYVSDVLTGLAIGAGISAMVTHLTRRAEGTRSVPAQPTPPQMMLKGTRVRG
jgi:membrane-associated phospholipid phosphatase